MSIDLEDAGGAPGPLACGTGGRDHDRGPVTLRAASEDRVATEPVGYDGTRLGFGRVSAES